MDVASTSRGEAIHAEVSCVELPSQAESRSTGKPLSSERRDRGDRGAPGAGPYHWYRSPADTSRQMVLEAWQSRRFQAALGIGRCPGSITISLPWANGPRLPQNSIPTPIPRWFHHGYHPFRNRKMLPYRHRTSESVAAAPAPPSHGDVPPGLVPPPGQPHALRGPGPGRQLHRPDCILRHRLTRASKRSLQSGTRA